MVPVVSFIVIFEAVAKSSEKFKIVEKMCSYLLMIIGLSLLAYTLKTAINEYKSLGLFDTLIVFSIPLILSILYLPIAYVFAIHSIYQMIFLRVTWDENLTKEQVRKRKWKIFKVCRLSREKLLAFEKSYVKFIYKNIDEYEFNELLKSSKILKREKFGTKGNATDTNL